MAKKKWFHERKWITLNQRLGPQHVHIPRKWTQTQQWCQFACKLCWSSPNTESATGIHCICKAMQILFPFESICQIRQIKPNSDPNQDFLITIPARKQLRSNALTHMFHPMLTKPRVCKRRGFAFVVVFSQCERGNNMSVAMLHSHWPFVNAMQLYLPLGRDLCESYRTIAFLNPIRSVWICPKGKH